MVLGGTGSVSGIAGWYMVVLGQYRAVLVGSWLLKLTLLLLYLHQTRRLAEPLSAIRISVLITYELRVTMYFLDGHSDVETIG